MTSKERLMARKQKKIVIRCEDNNYRRQRHNGNKTKKFKANKNLRKKLTYES